VANILREMIGVGFPLLAFSHCRDVVAAVSRAGGFGVLGGSSFSAEAQGTADAVRATAPSIDVDYQGPATIETYTLFHDRNGDVTSATVVARAESGGRTLATIPATDAPGIERLTGGMTEPVGSAGTVRRSAEGASIWNFTDFDDRS
jgi:hypothetical protein